MNIILNIITTTNDGRTDAFERTQVVQDVLSNLKPMRLVGITAPGFVVGTMGPLETVTYAATVNVPDHTKLDALPGFVQNAINSSMRNVIAVEVTINTEDTMQDNTDNSAKNTEHTMNIIGTFDGKYSFLSNFFKLRKGYFVYDRFPTSEHAFQAAKTLDDMERAFFENPKLSAYRAKLAGREVNLRPDWEQKKIGFMYHIVKDKFTRDPQLLQWLLDTGDAVLVEGNTWHDNIWGDCTCNVKPGRTGTKAACKKPGRNELGKILMAIREEMRPKDNDTNGDNTSPTPTEDNTKMPNDNCPECGAPITEMHKPECPRHSDNYDQHINDIPEDVTMPNDITPNEPDNPDYTQEELPMNTTNPGESTYLAYRKAVTETVHIVEKFATKSSKVTDEEWEVLESEEIRAQLNYAFTEGLFTSDQLKAQVIEMYRNRKNQTDKVKEDKTMKEATMPDPEQMLIQQFRLPDPNEKFRISFRLDNSYDWEEEIEVHTFGQAMHWLEDHVSNTGEYRVESVRGNETLTININYTKEDTVYEYKLAADWTANQDVRITTNVIPEAEKFALDTYNTLLEQGLQEVIIFKRQKEMTKEFIETTTGHTNNGLKVIPMFVSTNWRYVFLTERIIRVGGKFRVISLDKKALKKMDPDKVDNMIDRSSFAFSEGDNLTIFQVVDHTGHKITWEEFPAYLGIKVRNSSKLGKRLKEIMRYTLFAETGTKALDFELVNYDHLMDEFLEQGMTPQEAYDEAIKAVDGFQYVSESFFKRSIHNIPDKAVRGRSFGQVKEGEAKRFSFRLTTGMGLLKGDGAIAADSVLMEKFNRVPDVVQPVLTNPNTGEVEMINLKTEYATDGSWWIFTANMHHGHHQPMTNDQVLSIMKTNERDPWLFPMEELKESHLSFIGELYEALKNGEFPNFMKSDWMSSESGEVNMDPDRLAMRIQQLSVRWTASGRSLMEAGHFINMVGNGVWNRLNAAVNKRRKIMIPIPHAAYLHVTSLSVATMVGYDPEAEGYDTSKCFYYERIHSWVKPDAIFIRDYARHGGEDHDDSEIVIVRWTYDEDLGESAENPVLRAIPVRMPCAKGEYSIVEIDDTGFPYYNTWNEMPTVNITKGVRPEFIDEMTQEVQGLQYSNREVPTDYTPDECKYITSLILINPGIGRYINPLIAYYDTFGTYPPVQLANTEDIVDTLKQTPDEDAFIAINGEIDRLLDEIIKSGLVIDQHIYETRLQSVELPKDVSTTTSLDGYFYEMWSFTKAVMADWKQKVKELVRNREVIPVNTRLIELGMDKPDTIQVPDANGNVISVSRVGHTKWIMAMFNQAQARYGNIPKGEAKRQFSGKLNRSVCQMLDTMPTESRDWVLYTMYELIMDSKDKKDIILFQTPLDGNEFSVMDFFLNALYNIGLAAKVNYVDFTRQYKTLVKNVEITESGEGANGIF